MNAFWIDFWPFWAPFWVPKSIKNWSKFDVQLKTKNSQIWWPLQHFWIIFAFQKLQNSLKNQSKNQSKNCLYFILIFDWFLLHFGSQLGANIAPKSIKIDPKSDLENFQLFSSFFLPIWLDLAPPRTLKVVLPSRREANI